jgi:hypothetical protein
LKSLGRGIARAANVGTSAAERCGERVDPLLYHFFKMYARGRSEGAPPPADRGAFDTDRCSDPQFVDEAAFDTLQAFNHAPVAEKVRPWNAIAKGETEALQFIKAIDCERVWFIRHYSGAE